MLGCRNRALKETIVRNRAWGEAWASWVGAPQCDGDLAVAMFSRLLQACHPLSRMSL